MSDTVGRSWYTKYRPVTMEEYQGPEIKNIVAKRFKSRENMPHVIMISGKRGCGKTTFARIITKYYMCENPHPDGTPCEECQTCQDINERLINSDSSLGCDAIGIMEVDATINNGKTSIQDILDDAIEPPLIGDFKVIIFDECHELSRAAQNSLLKTIEDVPEHLIVIFATTNPEKVLPTIMSRCQLKLEARRQSVEDMAERLKKISELEGLKVSMEALRVISKLGERIPRECINLLESVATSNDGEVTVDTVTSTLGMQTSEVYFEFYNAASKGLEDILAFVRNIAGDDKQSETFVNGLIKFTFDSMYIKHGISLEDYTLEQIKAVKELFKLYDTNDFDMLLQILDDMSKQYSTLSGQGNLELLLTTTAMRVSKIKLLASGLNTTASDAIKENKISLYEHAKKLKENMGNADMLDESTLEVEDLQSEFSGLKQVENSAGLLDSKLFNIEPEEETEETLPEPVENDDSKSRVDSILDSFFDE